LTTDGLRKTICYNASCKNCGHCERCLNRESYYSLGVTKEQELFISDDTRDAFNETMYPDKRTKQREEAHMCGDVEHNVLRNQTHVRSKTKAYTGIVAGICRHYMLLSMVAMVVRPSYLTPGRDAVSCKLTYVQWHWLTAAQGGETFSLHWLAALGAALSTGIFLLSHTTDVGCKYDGFVLSRADALGMSPEDRAVPRTSSVLHGKSHCWYCAILYGVVHCRAGLGHHNGEVPLLSLHLFPAAVLVVHPAQLWPLVAALPAAAEYEYAPNRMNDRVNYVLHPSCFGAVAPQEIDVGSTMVPRRCGVPIRLCSGPHRTE